MYQYEATIIELINSAVRNLKFSPLMLGGISSSGGGEGGPPGGYVGLLPQYQIAYDTSELATDNTPLEGTTLLDNLNHIRYMVNDVTETVSGMDLSSTMAEAHPSVDHSASGLKTVLTAGTTLNFGNVCYMGGDGKMELITASSYSMCGGWAMCIDNTIPTSSGGTFLLRGFVTDNSWNWTVSGGFVYADPTTWGSMSQTIPSGADQVIQILGVASEATVIYFDPQLSMVEHV